MLPPPVTLMIGRRSGVGVGVGVRVGFVPVGMGVGVVGDGVGGGGTPQLIVYCVPPRAMSRLPFAWDVKVEPRRPTRTEPGPIGGPCVTNGFSLFEETLTVIVLLPA